jgi:hypothetical protein
MLRSKLLLPLALLFLLLLPAPMSWGDEFDEETAARTVSALLSRDPDDDVVKVWALSESLADGGKPAIKALREAAPGAAPAHRLAIARALILLEDYSEGLGMLRKLVEDESVTPALKVAALKEIGIEGELEDAEWLEEQIDVTLDPAVKMAMAKSLWYLNFTNKKKGKEVLLQYMRSTDPDLRAEGALALGEIGAAGEAKAVLLDLRNEPTERGRSAAFLLKILNLEAIQDQGLREPPPEEPPGATAGGSSKWPLLDEVMSLLGRYYLDLEAVDRRRIEDAMASGITKALDPFTNYLSEEEHALLLEGLDPTYGGVGAYVFNDPDNKERFTISRPIFGGPIYRAGLRTGDIILSIDGTSTDGLAVEECVRLLKGPPGTDVTITVARIGWPDNRDFTLTRAGRRSREGPRRVRAPRGAGHPDRRPLQRRWVPPERRRDREPVPAARHADRFREGTDARLGGAGAPFHGCGRSPPGRAHRRPHQPGHGERSGDPRRGAARAREGAPDRHDVLRQGIGADAGARSLPAGRGVR